MILTAALATNSGTALDFAGAPNTYTEEPLIISAGLKPRPTVQASMMSNMISKSIGST